MKRHVATNAWAFGVALLWVNFSSSPNAYANEKKVVAYVSILPQAYFVERIGGAHVEVEVMVGPGQSPETYEPTAKQIARLSKADVYFQIRVPFEKHLVKNIAANFPNLPMVDTTEGIGFLPLDEAHQHGQDHGGHVGDHDPHTWLDPRLAKVQAKHVCEALCRLDSEHATAFRENLKGVERDLDEAHQKLAEALSPVKGKSFYVFHSAFGYFAAAFGLKQAAVETGGKEPGARRIAALVEQAKRDGVKLIFVQPQFSKSTARAIARSIGGVVLDMDPLAKDYLKNLDEMAAKIHQALGDK